MDTVTVDPTSGLITVWKHSGGSEQRLFAALLVKMSRVQGKTGKSGQKKEILIKHFSLVVMGPPVQILALL